MLISFYCKNYLSFKDEVFLDFRAKKFTQFKDNVITEKSLPVNLVKSIIMYGANASGKSNLIKAISFVRDFALGNIVKQSQEDIPYTPYRFNKTTESNPSSFEIHFFVNDKLYRYGFTANKSTISKEWFFIKDNPKAKNETKIFTRQYYAYASDILDDKFLEIIKSKTRDNGLAITVLDSYNEKDATVLLKEFSNITVILGLEHEKYRDKTIELLRNEKYSDTVKQFMKFADTGIEDIKIKDYNLSKDPSKPDLFRLLYTSHKAFDINNDKLEYNYSLILDFDESSGTIKYFNLIGVILDSLNNGKTLIIDEFETSLHPILSLEIIKLFNSNNNAQAQLFITSHDTNLLNYGNFRRDQIYFVEKNNFGESNIYSLADFKDDKTGRSDSSFAKNYIEGKYGAIPYLSNFGDLLKNDKK
ncbi:MAG: ATP-binding protein [bacterium]